jgi:hypothetical protein
MIDEALKINDITAHCCLPPFSMAPEGFLVNLRLAPVWQAAGFVKTCEQETFEDAPRPRAWGRGMGSLSRFNEPLKGIPVWATARK